MRVYIAGPMTGIPKFNYPAFDETAASLRADGYEVVNPAELDGDEVRRISLASPDGNIDTISSHGQTHGDFLARDVKIIADGGIEAIVVLDGWEKSSGARHETFVGYLKHIPILWIEGPAESPGLYPVQRLDLFRAWTEEENLYVYVAPYKAGSKTWDPGTSGLEPRG